MKTPMSPFLPYERISGANLLGAPLSALRSGEQAPHPSMLRTCLKLLGGITLGLITNRHR